MFEIKFLLVEQLALYQMFHQDKQNKKLHHLGLPMVLYSGFIFFGLLALPSPNIGIPFQDYLFPLNFGSLFFAVTLLPFSLLDKRLAVLTLFWVYPLFVLANMTLQLASWYWVLPFAAVIQFLGWYIPIAIGHQKLEAAIVYDNQEVSSNIYFQKYLFWLHNVGREPSILDSWNQYVIAPFYMTLDLLASFGYLKKLQQEIDVQMQLNLKRMAEGRSIYK